jgi:Heavy-metal resistance
MKTMKQYHQQANPGQRSLHTITMSLIIMAVLVTGAIAAEIQTAPVAKEPFHKDLHSPYAEQHNAAETGLLPNEFEALSMGTGMAMALPAELNGYPGPRHVLDAADAGQFSLSPGQRETIQNLYDGMLSEARARGQEIIQAEAQLTQGFRHADMDEAKLREILERIANLRRELRFIHLRTHLKTRAMLTHEQIERYNAVRGYDADRPHSGH